MQDISFVYGLSKLLSEINWFLCLPQYVNGIMESLENALILRNKKRKEKKENPSTFRLPATLKEAGKRYFFFLTTVLLHWRYLHLSSRPHG